MKSTLEIVLDHPTDCELTKISEASLRADLERETGLRPSFSFQSFLDPHVDARQSISSQRRSPFLADDA